MLFNPLILITAREHTDVFTSQKPECHESVAVRSQAVRSSGSSSVIPSRETILGLLGSCYPLRNSIHFLLTKSVSSVSGGVNVLDKLDWTFLKWEGEGTGTLEITRVNQLPEILPDV